MTKATLSGTAGHHHREELTIDGVRAAIEPTLTKLARSSSAREQARDHAFEDVRALAAAGVTLAGVSRDEGGAGGSGRDVAELVIEIARADSNVAQALRTTFATAHQVASDPRLPRRDTTLRRLLDRDLFAGTSNERAGGGAGQIATVARRDGDDWIITGEKYYSTGGLYANWFSAQARADDGTIVGFTVPVERAGVHVLDDFDAVGQRLTASGTTRLVDVRVTSDEVEIELGAGDPPDNPWHGTWAQLYLATVEAGIAARVLDEALEHVRHRARPIKHSTASRSVDDPYVRQTVGEIAARAQAARAVVLLAAETLDDLRGRTGTDARTAAAAAASHVAAAGVIAIESALKASELLFDVGGGSATSRGLGLDRHWRNARTIANHNPRQWKQSVTGAYLLTGEEPPANGLF